MTITRVAYLTSCTSVAKTNFGYLHTRTRSRIMLISSSMSVSYVRSGLIFQTLSHTMITESSLESWSVSKFL